MELRYVNPMGKSDLEFIKECVRIGVENLVSASIMRASILCMKKRYDKRLSSDSIAYIEEFIYQAEENAYKNGLRKTGYIPRHK